MRYLIDVHILVYATAESSPQHRKARVFLQQCADNPDLLCLTWLTLLAYQRIATHLAVFTKTISPRLHRGH